MTKLSNLLSALLTLSLILFPTSSIGKKRQTCLMSQQDFLYGNIIIDSLSNKCLNISSDNILDSDERESMRAEMRKGYSGRYNITRNEDDLYTVKCVFKGEYQPYFAIYNNSLFLESKNKIWDNTKEDDVYYFQVPEGTYDIYTQYYSNVQDMKGLANIIHEDIHVTSDMDIYFSADELTEKIILKPLLKDGEEVIFPRYIPLDEEPWFKTDETGANTKFAYLTYILFREECDVIYKHRAIQNCIIEGIDSETCLLSNKLSDKYHLVFQYFIADYNDEFQISTTDIKGINSGIVNNHISGFVKYNTPLFAKSPLFNEYEPTQNLTAIEGSLWLDDVQQGSGGMYTGTSHPSVFCAVQPMDINIKAPVKTTSVQAEKVFIWETDFGDGDIQEFSETRYAEIVALPSVYNGKAWEYVNQNHSSCGSPYYQLSSDGPIIEYPGHPAYSHFSSQILHPLANSAPILSICSQVNKYPDASIFRFNPEAYIGRYGEVRNCDQWCLRSVVKLNGVTVFENINDLLLDDWCIENSIDGHEKGIIEATFTNRNVLVDETIPGFNITSIKVDERNEDLCAPTTQMLIFKNADGKITDRFAKAEDGIIEFSAGDFNWIDDKNYYSCEEAEVKVEYAPYGEQTFLPLEVTEIPENYFMPGFGYFYRGSLKDVAIPSANGWYDLRFTLTDKAGNEMVQHISPAFRIDNNVGVTAPAVNGLKVWSANGTVFAAGDDIASIELFTPDGKRIAYANANSVSSNGYRGIAIVRVTSSDGSASTLKTAIP